VHPRYNLCIVQAAAILGQPDSVERTAAFAEWLQSLYPTDPPVLVGGSAVELYTAGAYRSGDLDFVGEVPPAVAAALESAGFRRTGRHWVHERSQLFVEFPSRTLHPPGEVSEVLVGSSRVRAISPEALIVDRLSAWVHWQSQQDAANAWLLLRGTKVDRKRLGALAAGEGVSDALAALLQAAKRWRGDDPSAKELEEWTRNGLVK
jgi:hypothetical protein